MPLQATRQLRFPEPYLAVSLSRGKGKGEGSATDYHVPRQIQHLSNRIPKSESQSKIVNFVKMPGTDHYAVCKGLRQSAG